MGDFGNDYPTSRRVFLVWLKVVKGFFFTKIYKDTLQNQVTEILRNKPNGIQFGVNLTDAQLNQFQEEQIGQLHQLMTESTKPCQQFNIQDSPDHK
ncbi:succinate dehydrogenase assembly factor 3, mitochondrial isoform X2 [Erpetoichthys calabaricus]|uniref:succinate dehydrogenase assembly factor 3, mitochondrial isoform X2 n=1 Tax=Erpetoichthys calabaricus TaxID=27687 RepID=UPI0010A06EC3|nr:succinate dehydrogenase assembly factor 3, mitochondrial isoform X2 [Erpetoichthys calabaricus]